MPPRRASKKASALTLGEEAQPPSGIPKGKKQQPPPGAGPDNVAAVTNTMSVDVVVNDPSTGGGPKAASSTGSGARSLRSHTRRVVATNLPPTTTNSGSNMPKDLVLDSKKRPPSSPRVSRKSKAAKVSNKSSNEPLAQPQAPAPDDANLVPTKAQGNPSRRSQGKRMAQNQVESESDVAQPIPRLKPDIPHLPPSMDVDDEESDLQDSNNAQDTVAQPSESRIDKDRNDKQPHREASETGDEAGSDASEMVDIKMVSRAMHASEHPSWSDDGRELEELEEDGDVTIIAHNPTVAQNDTDNEDTAPASEHPDVHHNQPCLRRAYALQDVTATDMHEMSHMTKDSSRKVQQELRGSRTQASSYAGSHASESRAPVSRPNSHADSRASSHIPDSYVNSRASSHAPASRPNSHASTRAQAPGSRTSNSHANSPVLGSRAPSVSNSEEVQLPKPQTVGKRERNRLVKQKQETVSWDNDGSEGHPSEEMTVDIKKEIPAGKGAITGKNSSSESAWPEWTDLKFQGRQLNLTNQSDEIQNVARAVKDIMIRDILFNDAYPHEADRLATGRENMKIIARELGYSIIAERIDSPHEQSYFKSLFGIPNKRLNNFNSDIKSIVNNSISSFYHNDIQVYKTMELSDVNDLKIYIFPLKPENNEPDGSQPYKHPGLIKILRDCLAKFKLIKNYKSSFPVYNGRTEVPLRFLAYLATLLHILLIDKISNEGDKENMQPASVTYEEHLNVLEALQKKKKTRYHDIMSQIFDKAIGTETKGVVAQTSKTLQLMDLSPIKPS